MLTKAEFVEKRIARYSKFKLACKPNETSNELSIISAAVPLIVCLDIDKNTGLTAAYNLSGLTIFDVTVPNDFTEVYMPLLCDYDETSIEYEGRQIAIKKSTPEYYKGHIWLKQPNENSIKDSKLPSMVNHIYGIKAGGLGLDMFYRVGNHLTAAGCLYKHPSSSILGKRICVNMITKEITSDFGTFYDWLKEVPPLDVVNEPLTQLFFTLLLSTTSKNKAKKHPYIMNFDDTTIAEHKEALKTAPDTTNTTGDEIRKDIDHNPLGSPAELVQSEPAVLPSIFSLSNNTVKYEPKMRLLYEILAMRRASQDIVAFEHNKAMYLEYYELLANFIAAYHATNYSELFPLTCLTSAFTPSLLLDLLTDVATKRQFQQHHTQQLKGLKENSLEYGIDWMLSQCKESKGRLRSLYYDTLLSYNKYREPIGKPINKSYEGLGLNLADYLVGLDLDDVTFDSIAGLVFPINVHYTPPSEEGTFCIKVFDGHNKPTLVHITKESFKSVLDRKVASLENLEIMMLVKLFSLDGLPIEPLKPFYVESPLFIGVPNSFKAKDGLLTISPPDKETSFRAYLTVVNIDMNSRKLIVNLTNKFKAQKNNQTRKLRLPIYDCEQIH